MTDHRGIQSLVGNSVGRVKYVLRNISYSGSPHHWYLGKIGRWEFPSTSSSSSWHWSRSRPGNGFFFLATPNFPLETSAINRVVLRHDIRSPSELYREGEFIFFTAYAHWLVFFFPFPNFVVEYKTKERTPKEDQKLGQAGSDWNCSYKFGNWMALHSILRLLLATMSSSFLELRGSKTFL